jgi:hypothetical protein
MVFTGYKIIGLLDGMIKHLSSENYADANDDQAPFYVADMKQKAKGDGCDSTDQLNLPVAVCPDKVEQALDSIAGTIE